MVEPGVKMALEATESGRIGIIGTEATIDSGRYPELIKEYHPHYKVYDKACPLFVPLVEDGWINTQVTHMVISEYLGALLKRDIDTLILGCTHYPILQDGIREVIGNEITLINPANEAAHDMGEKLLLANMRANQTPQHQFYVSDHSKKMKEVVERILGTPIQEEKGVNIEYY